LRRDEEKKEQGEKDREGMRRRGQHREEIVVAQGWRM
jgi:hypothetical protein